MPRHECRFVLSADAEPALHAQRRKIEAHFRSLGIRWDDAQYRITRRRDGTLKMEVIYQFPTREAAERCKRSALAEEPAH